LRKKFKPKGMSYMNKQTQQLKNLILQSKKDRIILEAKTYGKI